MLFATKRFVKRLTASLAMSYGSSGRVVARLTRSALGLPAPSKLEVPISEVSLKRSRTMDAISWEPHSAPVSDNPPFKRARVLTRPVRLDYQRRMNNFWEFVALWDLPLTSHRDFDNGAC